MVQVSDGREQQRMGWCVLLEGCYGICVKFPLVELNFVCVIGAA